MSYVASGLSLLLLLIWRLLSTSIKKTWSGCMCHGNYLDTTMATSRYLPTHQATSLQHRDVATQQELYFPRTCLRIRRPQVHRGSAPVRYWCPIRTGQPNILRIIIQRSVLLFGHVLRRTNDHLTKVNYKFDLPSENWRRPRGRPPKERRPSWTPTN